jgi:hypothetical protein
MQLNLGPMGLCFKIIACACLSLRRIPGLSEPTWYAFQGIV